MITTTTYKKDQKDETVMEPKKSSIASTEGITSTSAPASLSDKISFQIVTAIIKRFFRVGNVELCYHDLPGTPVGNAAGEKFVVRFQSRSALWKILYKPSLNIGKIFMDRGWELEQGDLGRFMGLLLKNEELLEETFFFKSFDAISSTLGHALSVNSVDRSHQNVQHHYDLGNDLYESFLDQKMIYSCAFLMTALPHWKTHKKINWRPPSIAWK
jgi:mycolic acid cyclopropane synthetase